MAKNKTNINVTAVFDGELDATDVFVSLIAKQYAERYQNKDSQSSYNENISTDYLVKSQDTVYNDSEVQKSQPSGLCG